MPKLLYKEKFEEAQMQILELSKQIQELKMKINMIVKVLTSKEE